MSILFFFLKCIGTLTFFWLYLHLTLQADEVDVQIKAINLVGKLFALQHRVAQNYPLLFMEFLKRFSDKSVDVKISALQCAKVFYLANPCDGTESCDIMSKLLDKYSSLIVPCLVPYSIFKCPDNFVQLSSLC